MPQKIQGTESIDNNLLRTDPSEKEGWPFKIADVLVTLP